MGSTLSRDVCNRNAILKRSEEVYLSQEVRFNFELDLTDLITTLDKILSSKEPFTKEIYKYSTMEKLRAKEPNVLIPFNNRVNLIYVNGTSREVIDKCATLKTSVFSFDSVDEIGLMTEIMKEKDLTKIAFVPFMSLTELLGRESQQYLWQRPATYTSQQFSTTLLGIYKVDGNLDVISAAADVVSSFCSKPANPFDSLDFDQFESRTWLKLVDRSSASLKVFEKLYIDLKDNLKNMKIDTKSSDTTTRRKVTWVVPSEMLRAVEFVSNYDTPLAWESATGDTLQQLSMFTQDMSVIIEYMSEQIVFMSDKMTIYPKFEKEGLAGMIMREMIFKTKSAADDEDPSKTILQGEAIGKSLTDLTKVAIYKGFAHGYDSHRPVDSIIVSKHGSYRAVPQFEDLKWECTISKSKKICSDTERGMDERQMICGDYFFGRTENYHLCPLTEVLGPVVFSSICGIDSEVLSSYYKDYKLSLWCNGYLSETLDMPPGVSTISTKCEVRSADGRSTFTHQNGLIVEKGATFTKLSSTTKNIVQRTVEDVLGWPATGSIIGTILLSTIGFCICILKYKKRRWFRRNKRYESPSSVARGVDKERVAELVEMATSRVNQPSNVPNVTVYNFSPEERQGFSRRLAIAN